MPRLATYLIPDPASRLYQTATAILGYDVFAERDVDRPEALRPCAESIREWIGPAHVFGIHATIGDALEFPDDQFAAIEDRLAEIARRTPPFLLTNGRIHTGFREFPRALVATFDNEDGALRELEDRVVTEINVLRSASPHFGARSSTYAGLLRTQFEQFGSPHVRSLFDLHFTLATGVPDAETWHLLANLFVTELGLFSSPDQTTFAVDKLYLLEQRPDGRYGVRRTYPLTANISRAQPMT
jgi:Protein of unknown function (DUF1045)